MVLFKGPSTHDKLVTIPPNHLFSLLLVFSATGGLIEQKGQSRSKREKRNARVGDECGLGRVPSEGADAELQGSEPLSGVAELEVVHVGAVELEGVPPRSTGDAAHLQVNPHERGLPHTDPELLQGLRQVSPRHLLHRYPATSIVVSTSAARCRRGRKRAGG